MDILLSKDVVLFKYGDIWIIGNKKNGLFGGLDEEGKHFIDRLLAGEGYNHDESVIYKDLIAFLEENSFFKDHNDRDNNNNLDLVYLHVTNDCPLNCLGCYSDDITRNKRSFLDFETICDVLKQLKNLGLQSLVISGGEPLLRRDIVNIVKYAKEKAKIPYVVILTSGVTLRQPLADELAKYIDELSISIDGYDEENQTFLRDKGIFYKIQKAIEIAKEASFKKIRVLPTLHKKNYNNTQNYLEYAKKHNVGISFSLLTVPPDDYLKDWILDDEDLTELGRSTLSIGENIGIINSNEPLSISDYHINVCEKCGIGDIIISIASDGSIYPCHMCHTNELKIGHVLEDSIAEVINNSRESFAQYGVDDTINNKCKSCVHKYFCGGGCRARAFMFSNKLDGEDPYCPMFKQFFKGFKSTIHKVKN